MRAPPDSRLAVPNRSWTVTVPGRRPARADAACDDVPLDHDVQLARDALQQQVAHGAADQGQVTPVAGDREQLGTAGYARQALDHERRALCR